MEKVLLFNDSGIPARTNQQQLKIIMNMPVRVISGNKVMDILPLATERVESSLFIPRRRNLSLAPFKQPTLNQMILFFQDCKLDDLIYSKEVASIYQIAQRTVNKWTNRGVFINYRITPSLTVYKRSELPTIAEVFGASYDIEA